MTGQELGEGGAVVTYTLQALSDQARIFQQLFEKMFIKCSVSDPDWIGIHAGGQK